MTTARLSAALPVVRMFGVGGETSTGLVGFVSKSRHWPVFRTEGISRTW